MAGVTSPWVPVEPLADREFAALRRRAVFECDKWDPQVGDACVIARHPLVVRREAWEHVVELAEALAREALAAEAELVHRPELHRQLGLPRAVRRALAHAHEAGPCIGVARIIRFDFHYTPDGWRISEANVDVPGGLNEASGFPPIVAPHYPWAQTVGDPVDEYVGALLRTIGPGGCVALIHATAYSDDRQMMTFIARRLEQAGVRAILASPAHLRCHAGRASVHTQQVFAPLDAIVRFFPGEWLQGLPRSTGWSHFFAAGRTPTSNPATALMTQSKRWPLVWDALRTPLPTWRRLLPETRDPRDAPWRTSDEWIVKPALGRVGEGIGMRDLIDAKEWRSIQRGARFWPSAWIAQRRFVMSPVMVGGVDLYPCLGVYTVDDRVAGAYGRLARRPLIDAHATDAAVLTAA